MTWFRVDDKLHGHTKAWEAGRDALGLWVIAGSWCMDQKTDGFVPSMMLARIGGDGATEAAQQLVDVELWHEDERKGKPGYRFHDWADFQITRAETEAKHDARSEGAQQGNHRRWHVGRGIVDPSCSFCSTDQSSDQSADRTTDHDTDQGTDSRSDESTESHANPPNPTHTQPKPSSGSRKRDRATRIPEDFAVDDDMVTWARERTPNVDGRTETEKFVNYWIAKSGRDATKLDWVRTWQNWMLRAQEQAGGSRPKQTTTANGRPVTFQPPQPPLDMADNRPGEIPAWLREQQRRWRLAIDAGKTPKQGVELDENGDPA